jgi:cytochrome c biogenesis protein CcmG, thiol:disulfide interchange protein DsbE
MPVLRTVLVSARYLQRAARFLNAAPIVHNANVMKTIPTIAAVLLAAALTLPSAYATEAGQPAPAFSLPTAKGDTVALDKLRGKVVYVDFWASWCGPCRRSFPWMNEMQQKYGAKGFTVVAVNVDKKRGDAEKFLVQNPANFTVVYDEAGTTPAAYGVKGMPSSYLVDARGNVTFVERGFLDESKADLENRVATLLAAAKN